MTLALQLTRHVPEQIRSDWPVPVGASGLPVEIEQAVLDGWRISKEEACASGTWFNLLRLNPRTGREQIWCRQVLQWRRASGMPVRSAPASRSIGMPASVTMTDRAFAQLEALHLSDAVESAGALFGTRCGDAIRIEEIVRAQTDDYGPSHATFDSQLIDQLSRWKGRGRGSVLLGTWHTHPRGLTTPSKADIRSWRSWQKASGEPFVGMLVTASREQWRVGAGGDWKSPVVHARVVDDQGKLSRARVELKPAWAV
jgi:integrative and conjugative element protein (TIGR02256 family)